VRSITSKGNVVLISLDNSMNLIIGPEYGGKIFYHQSSGNVGKFHLKLAFDDGSVLTIRLTSMGVIQALKDEELDRSYVYKRDFSGPPSSLDEGFTFNRFSKDIAAENRMLKSLLVGKDAVVIGLSNSAFQDVIYRAGLHPKRKGSELNVSQRRALYDAVMLVVQDRLKLGGKTQFQDLYGQHGSYIPAMGSNMKEKNCINCGTLIEKIAVGGGQTYYCPNCQR
jgi:formamidopyrimidine-DNA glycosylase